MKILRRIFIAIAILIGLVLIVALFVPNEFKSERQISINKSKEEVFDYIKYIKNQDNYGVWQLSDPKMKKSYKGEDGTVGFVYSWNSESMGEGSQKITKIKEGERLETELNFGFGEPAHAYFTTTSEGENKTKVVWGITGKSPYPWNIMSLFYDMGNDFDEGLKNLKKELEK